MSTVISVEHLSKAYRLGQIGTGTFSRDLEVWWAKLRHKPNPLLRIGETDHGNRDGEELWALRDVSFTVEQGEVLGIIGRNGAGKSTLLKILSRVTAPTSGKVKVKGRIASLLEVGTGFHPELTGRENIYLNGAILGMQRREIDRKFDEIVDFAEVEKFIDTPVKRYSSGMYVRLAFAVAAHLDPEILVVDEVLAVGDAEFQKKCLGKMGDVAKEGRTVLFVSHNMAAVQSLCTRCLIIQNGEIAFNGEVSKSIQMYIEGNLPAGKNFYELKDIIRAKNLGLQIKFSRCAVLDSQNEPTTTIRFGESFSILLESIADSPQRGLNMVIGIDTIQQIRITTVRSEDLGILFNVSDLSPTRIIARFNEIVLYPGKYLITLAIRKGKIDLDVLWHIASFEVTELHFDGMSPYKGEWGLVKTNVNWSANEKD